MRTSLIVHVDRFIGNFIVFIFKSTAKFSQISEYLVLSLEDTNSVLFASYNIIVTYFNKYLKCMTPTYHI